MDLVSSLPGWSREKYEYQGMYIIRMTFCVEDEKIPYEFQSFHFIKWPSVFLAFFLRTMH